MESKIKLPVLYGIEQIFHALSAVRNVVLCYQAQALSIEMRSFQIGRERLGVATFSKQGRNAPKLEIFRVV